MTLYFISGLGIDRRAFIKIKLSRQYKIKHLQWIEPLQNESLQHYSLRLAKGIDTSEPYSIIGLSMGGMVATEISKVFSPKHVILISSAVTYKEIPKRYHFLGKLKLHKLVPGKWMKKTSLLTFWMFGTKTWDEKLLLRQIIKDTDPRFLKWAITSILSWRNKTVPSNLFHIHGDKDRVLPCSIVKAHKVIKGGSHLVVFSHAQIVSALIEERLAT